MFWFAVCLTLVALTFDFLNGFHDAANSIATVVSTRVLSPRIAVIWAAFFNFVAAFTFGTAVARTMGTWHDPSGIRKPVRYSRRSYRGDRLGYLTWYYGLPISSSHALIGGYAGAAVAKAGWKVIIRSGWTKTLLFIGLSPILGMVLGGALMIAVYWLFRNFSPVRVDRHFRKLQLLSAAAYSFGHGTNDAQKTMGIIAGVLFTAGILDHFYIPFWVVLMAHTAIGLGTLAGGWRIVRTMGMRITRPKAGGRVLRRDRSRHQPVGSGVSGHSGFNHSHDRRSHHGCGQRPATDAPCTGEWLGKLSGRGC